MAELMKKARRWTRDAVVDGMANDDVAILLIAEQAYVAGYKQHERECGRDTGSGDTGVGGMGDEA